MPPAYASVTPRSPWSVAMVTPASNDLVYFESADGSDFEQPSEPAHYAFATSPWQSQIKTTTDIRQRLVIDAPPGECSLAMLKFFGRPASTSSAAFAVGALWGISQLSDGGDPETIEYLGEYLGQFDLTMGTVTATGSDILTQEGVGDGIFGRRATVRVDRAMFPGMRSVGSGSTIPSNAGPLLLVDCFGYSQLIVELRVVLADGGEDGGGAAATQAGFVYRFA